MKFLKNVLVCVVLALSLSSVEGQIANQLKFIFFSRNPNGEKIYNVSNLPSILSDVKFDRTKPTVFFFYGFTQSPKTEKVVSVRDAYLDNGGYNFIMVSVSTVLYNVLGAKSISRNTAESIQKLVDAGYELSKVEIVGFSIGAQIGALTARSIQNFPRLTGLDPGKVENIPLFGNPVDKILSSSDAAFVLTIHSEKRSFGDDKSLGHVNAFFNGAERQPMCVIPVIGIEDRACSHTQSLLFWAEAVRSNASTVFPARRCNNYSEFQSNTCDTNTPIAYINAKTPATTARGSYFLNTFQYSPYSKATANP